MNESSLFVVSRVVLHEKPTILTILSERSQFQFKGFTPSEGPPAFICQSFPIVRMQQSGSKFGCLNVICREAAIVEHLPIYLQKFAVWFENDDVLRNRIDDQSQFHLLTLKPRLHLLTIVDVCIRSVPPDYVILRVSYGDGAKQEPAILSIKATQACLDFDRFGGGEVVTPCIH